MAPNAAHLTCSEAKVIICFNADIVYQLFFLHLATVTVLPLNLMMLVLRVFFKVFKIFSSAANQKCS